MPCLLSTVPLRGHFVKGREKTTFMVISLVPSGPFKQDSSGLGGLCFHPLFLPTLGAATLRAVVSYPLMSLCEITMTLINQLTQHAKHVAHVLLCDQSYLTSSCTKQTKLSHNNNKVGTHLKANALPFYVYIYKPKPRFFNYTKDSAAFCTFPSPLYFKIQTCKYYADIIFIFFKKAIACPHYHVTALSAVY